MSKRDAGAESSVVSAVSFIAAQTVQQIAARAGVDAGTVLRVLQRLEALGDVERQGKRYRFSNAIPWHDAVDPLPPLTISHTIVTSGGKYAVTVSQPKTGKQNSLFDD